MRWRADRIIVESASVGLGLIKDLRCDTDCESAREHHAPNCDSIAITPREGKHERMMAQVERLYEGFAKFPRAAPWLDDLRHEMLAFPEGRHDYQVDSISQFLRHAINRLGGSFLDENYRPNPPRRP
jgi:hypothetical protein